MNYVYADITLGNRFYGKTNPAELVEKYGSPLYVYNENILRERCREITGLVNYPKFIVNYSAKANCNLELLKIIREEGLHVDAMSPGEIYVELKAGFRPDQILYICNNVSAEEMKFAIDAGITVSVDSLSQLDLFGRMNPGGKVVVRFNPGVGAGHHKKVVTAGRNTKFGIDPERIEDVKSLLKEHSLDLTGINQHIGSLFMDGAPYIKGIKSLLEISGQFENLEFVDFGGGFGVPYHKQENEKRLDLKKMGGELDRIIKKWTSEYGKKISFKVEPGRYISAECGVLLGTVHSVKMNNKKKYVGTDLGFNVLMRPVLYNSVHEVEIYRAGDNHSNKEEAVTIVGNICETGDIMAADRLLPEIFENDILGVLDAGAYGYVMSSNYNNRLRPAEVLIDSNGGDRLIRERDTLEDLVRQYPGGS